LSRGFCVVLFLPEGEVSPQKSNEGLLRALLYQIIKQVPSLSALVLEVLTPPGECSTNIENFEWKFDCLRKAIENIKDYASQTGKIKICIFIDGLDEYQSFDELMQEQSNIQGKLAANTWESSKHRQSLKDIGNLVLELAYSPQVKLCCSSRPETTFDSIFRIMPSINLEDLTELDIGRFVSEKLEESKAMSSSLIEPTEKSQLIQKTVFKARGVFLWVKLVVDRMIEELEDGTTFDKLDRLLRSLPSELFGLYKEMLSKSDPQHLKEGLELFQLFLARKRDISALTLFSAATETTDSVLSQRYTVNPVISTERALRITDTMRKMLKSRCAGLLELSQAANPALEYSTDPGNTIRFLHQTVKEFLEADTWTQSHLQQVTEGFEPTLNLLRASTLRLKTFCPIQISNVSIFVDGPFGSEANKYAREAVFNQTEFFRHQINEVLSYARFLEEKTAYHSDVHSLLDDVDLTASNLIKFMEPESRSGAVKERALNWTLLIPVRHRYSLYHYFGDNFLSLATQHNLESYLRAKASGGLQKAGLPLMHYALGRHISLDDMQYSIELGVSTLGVIKLLLELGASPNEDFEVTAKHTYSVRSPWQLALSLSFALLNGGARSLRDLIHDLTQAHVRLWKRDIVTVIEVLLNAGAAVNAEVSVSLWGHDKSIAPFEAVSTWTERLEERDRILQMIRDRLANQPSEPAGEVVYPAEIPDFDL
jgi:hypothetical protein